METAPFHSPRRTLDLPSMRNTIGLLAARARHVDIRPYEIAPLERSLLELRPLVLELLDDTIRLLCDLMQSVDTFGTYAVEPGHDAVELDTVPSTYLPFERALDAAVALDPAPVRAVEELAFLAQLELRQRWERLSRLQSASHIAPLLTECDSSLRRIAKSLSALDATIAKSTHAPPTLDFRSELTASLQVRRAYGRFRAETLARGDPPPDRLRARLRLLGTQIAMLIGSDTYPLMRVRDRLILREFQQRLLHWLRGEHDATPASGFRIWTDFAVCMEMFSHVNRRQELREHDTAVIEAVLAHLRDDTSPKLDDSTVFDKVVSLQGLSPPLDELLGTAALDVGRIEDTLARLWTDFRSATPKSGAGVPPW